jgi:hypothetical protein
MCVCDELFGAPSTLNMPTIWPCAACQAVWGIVFHGASTRSSPEGQWQVLQGLIGVLVGVNGVFGSVQFAWCRSGICCTA